MSRRKSCIAQHLNSVYVEGCEVVTVVNRVHSCWWRSDGQQNTFPLASQVRLSIEHTPKTDQRNLSTICEEILPHVIEVCILFWSVNIQFSLMHSLEQEVPSSKRQYLRRLGCTMHTISLDPITLWINLHLRHNIIMFHVLLPNSSTPLDRLNSLPQSI